MMDYRGYFDVDKAEKLTAFGRCHSIRKLRVLVQVSEFFIGLAVVLLLKWHPTVLVAGVGTTGNCIRYVTGLFSSPASIFLVGNAIVVAVIVLSGGKRPDSAGRSGSEDIYDEYVSCTRGRPANEPPSASADTRAVQSTTSAVTVVYQVGIATIATVEGKEQDHEPTNEKGDDVRTEAPRKGDGPDRSRRSRSVEDLSTEEFNETVEKYITQTRQFLHKELLDELLQTTSP